MNSPARPTFFARLFSWRTARRAALTAAILGTLVAAFYVVENWRGRRAWENTRALIAANGYTLPRTFADLAPPPVDPSENAAETPILRALYDPDQAVAQAALARWKVAPGETITPSLLDSHAVSLAELAAALRRPHLRFPTAYEKGFGLTVPHVGGFLHAARLLSARAGLRLQQADPSGAADDVSTILRLAELTGHEGLLITQLTAAAISEIATKVIADGLAQDAWSASQRADLSRALARIDLLAGLRRAMFGEWGAASIYFDGHPDIRLIAPKEIPGLRLPVALVPTGWFDQARALMGRLYLENILPSVDVAARRVDLDRLREASLEIVAKKHHIASGHALAALIVPIYEKVVATLAEHQTRLDHARLALALADWRELHGSYPATLAELPPSANVISLRDLITGELYRYRPAPDGQSYRLHATGPDGRDDGGTPPASDDRNPKDWVWPGGVAR